MPKCFVNPYAIELGACSTVHLDVEKGVVKPNAHPGTQAYLKMMILYRQQLISSSRAIEAAKVAEEDDEEYISTADTSLVPAEGPLDFNLLAIDGAYAYFEVPQWNEGLWAEEFNELTEYQRTLPRAIAIQISKLTRFKFTSEHRSIQARVVFDVLRSALIDRWLHAREFHEMYGFSLLPEEDWQSISPRYKAIVPTSGQKAEYYLQELDTLQVGQSYLLEHVHSLTAITVYAEDETIRVERYAPETRTYHAQGVQARKVSLITREPIRPLCEFAAELVKPPELSLSLFAQLCSMPAGSVLETNDEHWQLIPQKELLSRNDILETHPEYSKDLSVSYHKWGATMVAKLVSPEESMTAMTGSSLFVVNFTHWMASGFPDGQPLTHHFELQVDAATKEVRILKSFGNVATLQYPPGKFSKIMRSRLESALSSRLGFKTHEGVETVRWVLVTKSKKVPFWRVGMTIPDKQISERR